MRDSNRAARDLGKGLIKKLHEYADFASGDYRDSVKRIRRSFWVALAAGLILSIATAWGVIKLSHGALADEAKPLFSGSPSFILLSLVAALSLYLRQVSMATADLRDNVYKGTEWNYPTEGTHAVVGLAKMGTLERTRENLGIASPFLILLSVIVAFRIVVETIVQFKIPALFSNVPWLRYVNVLPWRFLVDVVIASWLSLVFLMLAIVHYWARRREERIRIYVRRHENELRPKVEQPVESRQQHANIAPEAVPKRTPPTPSTERTVVGLGVVGLLMWLLSIADGIANRPQEKKPSGIEGR